MSEKLTQSPEQEKNPELENAGHERKAEIERNLERAAEKSKEGNVDQLNEKAKEAALEKEAKKDVSPAEKQKDAPVQGTKKTKKLAFERNMAEARSHMSAPSRAFSKVIHNKGIEKTSEVVGSTVARPNAILSGSVTAFLFTLALYLVARYYGYPLSGFETIGAFALGWIIGNMFDYIRIMVTGKKA